MKSAYLIFIIFLLLVSCAKKPKEAQKSKKMSEEEYKVLIARQEFLKGVPTNNIWNVKENERQIFIYTPFPKEGTVFVIKLFHNLERVIYVEASSDMLNFRYIAVENYDYFVDPFANELLYLIKVPYLYLLKGKFPLSLEITYVGDDGNFHRDRKKVVIFYKPFRKDKPYNYISDLDELIDYFKDNEDIKKQILQEIKNIDLERVPQDYRKLLGKLIEEFT